MASGSWQPTRRQRRAVHSGGGAETSTSSPSSTFAARWCEAVLHRASRSRQSCGGRRPTRSGGGGSLPTGFYGGNAARFARSAGGRWGRCRDDLALQRALPTGRPICRRGAVGLQPAATPASCGCCPSRYTRAGACCPAPGAGIAWPPGTKLLLLASLRTSAVANKLGQFPPSLPMLTTSSTAPGASGLQTHGLELSPRGFAALAPPPGWCRCRCRVETRGRFDRAAQFHLGFRCWGSTGPRRDGRTVGTS